MIVGRRRQSKGRRGRDAAGPLLSATAFSWLGLALALPMAPHLSRVPWWLGVVFVGALAWRWRVARLGRSPPPRWLLILLSLVLATTVIFQYQTFFGRDAGVALLSAMAAMKFLESRTVRDARVLLFLGYLLTMANLLFSQDLAMAGYVLLALTGVVAAHVGVLDTPTAVPPAVALRLAGRMLLQSIPLMLILFVLFPRLPGPLWRLPMDVSAARTGLSDSMSPGAISRLSLSSEVAFRVRFAGKPPTSSQLYWRGLVLDEFDGRTWKAAKEPLRGVLPPLEGGQPIAYSIILEPHGKRWLFALDLPAWLPPGIGVTESFQLRRRKPVDKLMGYEMRSRLDYRTGPLDRRVRRNSLALPPTGNDRTRALASTWRRRFVNPADRAGAALALFREQPFFYTLTPPLLGDESMDEFLFETRRGFCEHYAGSFVFLMRAAGVPARVVTGYQGGERNALGEYFTVRQSDAHAWAEIWLEGRGWVRIDPTAAVAPERVEQGLFAAVADPQTLPLLVRRDNPWLRQLVFGWDYLDNAWNEWVLAYGPDRQRALMASLGLRDADWRAMAVILMTVLGVTGAIALAYQAWYRRRLSDPATRIYRRFCAKLARRGLVRSGHEGPLAYAERVAAQRPDIGAQVKLIAGLYAGLRYGRLAGVEPLRRLRRLVNALRV